MSIRLFITGTDTDAGKTYVSVGLLNAFNKQQRKTLGVKPIASGSSYINGQLRNADALALQNASSIQLPYHQINPFTFEPAIAPHIAASYLQQTITMTDLLKKTQAALQHPADICITEGAGGWYVPLNTHETMADFVKAISFNVILVVGIRLGCINHAILTCQAIKADGVPLIGWIANCVEPAMSTETETIATLKTWLPAPCLGIVKHGGLVGDGVDIHNIC